MKHALPDLPYGRGELAPHLSAETLDYHYGKHHQTYVDNLNRLIEGGEFADAPLEDIVRRSTGAIFNNSAQVWNHTFYWNGLAPRGGGEPAGDLATAIRSAFSDFPAFQREFTQAAVSLFGAGWTWLVRKPNGSCAIVQTVNAGNPLTSGDTPLLTCDVWEHAYYIDYRNARAKYVEAFWRLVNWDFVGRNFKL